MAKLDVNVKERVGYYSRCQYCGSDTMLFPCKNDATKAGNEHENACTYNPDNTCCGSCAIFRKDAKQFVEPEDVFYGVPDTDVTYLKHRLCPKINTLVTKYTSGCEKWEEYRGTRPGTLIIEKGE